MLQFMRKQAKNWLMKLLLVIIIIVFVFYFGSTREHKDGDTLASVGKKAITYAEYRHEYENMLDMYRRLYGNTMAEEGIKKLNLKQKVLDSLVNQAVISLKVKDFGIRVTDEEIRNSILAYPAFQRDGAFDNRIYQQALRQFKMTPEDFEETQRRQIEATKLEKLVKEAAKVSDSELFDVYRMQNEKLNIEFMRVSSGSFGNSIRPSGEDLEKYLKDHGEDFRVPERIQLKYIVFQAEDYAGSTHISDEEVREYYEQHKNQFAAKEKDPPSLASVKDKIVAEIRAAKGADKASEAAKSARNVIYQDDNIDGYAAKNRLKVYATGLFPKNNPPAELARIKGIQNYLGNLQKDDLSPVITTPQGFFLFRAMDVRPSYIPPLSEAAEAVKRRYIESESRVRAKKEAEGLYARLKNGEDFGKVAQSGGLKTAETGLFLPGMDIPKIGPSKDLSQALFQISEKKLYPDNVFNVDGDYIIIRFKGKSAPDKKDFDLKKEGLKRSFLKIKEDMYFQSWLEESKDTLKKEGKLKVNKEAADL